MTEKERQRQEKKYAHLSDEYNLSSMMLSVWLKQELKFGRDKLPEWVTENMSQDDRRPDELPEVRGFWRVNARAGKQSQLNPSDIAIKLKSHYQLRPIVEHEQALHERAQLRDLSDLRCPVTAETMLFYTDLYKAARTSTTT